MSLYKTLGVRATARPEVIRAAYKKLMQRYHPDKNAGDAAAEMKAQQISQAFQILSDRVLRAKYDSERHQRLLRLPRLRKGVGFSLPEVTPVMVWVTLFIVFVALLVTAAGLYKRYEQRQAIALQQMEERYALQRKEQQDNEKKRLEQEAQEELWAAARADTQARAQRTIPIFDSHRYVAIKDKGMVQGFILPPVDVYIGKESSEKMASNISLRRAGLRKAVLRELGRIRAKDLTNNAAEGAVSASILRALNDSILGRDRQGQLCRRDFDEYVCHGIETVIFRGSVELVPG